MASVHFPVGGRLGIDTMLPGFEIVDEIGVGFLPEAPLPQPLVIVPDEIDLGDLLSVAADVVTDANHSLTDTLDTKDSTHVDFFGSVVDDIACKIHETPKGASPHNCHLPNTRRSHPVTSLSRVNTNLLLIVINASIQPTSTQGFSLGTRPSCPEGGRRRRSPPYPRMVAAVTHPPRPSRLAHDRGRILAGGSALPAFFSHRQGRSRSGVCGAQACLGAVQGQRWFSLSLIELAQAAEREPPEEAAE